MNRHLLDKNLDVFPQNSTFLIQILMIILKIDVTLKSFLAVQFFNYCLILVPLDHSGYYFILLKQEENISK